MRRAIPSTTALGIDVEHGVLVELAGLGHLGISKLDEQRVRISKIAYFHGTASVYKAITEVVPSNPDHPDFRVGHTLAADYAHWRRVKRGLPARYRLFYRFSTRPAKIIVHAWLNDEATLRKAGAKTDVYAVFGKMLARGEVPSDIEDLKKWSRDLGE